MTAQPRDAVLILNEHQRFSSHTCLCGAVLGARLSVEQRDAAHATHQALMLAAGGYPVTAAGLAEVKAAAWDQGQRAEETAWKHVFDGHPVPEGEMCGQCEVRNPYRTEGEGRG